MLSVLNPQRRPISSLIYRSLHKEEKTRRIEMFSDSVFSTMYKSCINKSEREGESYPLK